MFHPFTEIYEAGAWIPTICGFCVGGVAARTRSGKTYVGKSKELARKRRKELEEERKKPLQVARKPCPSGGLLFP